MQVVWLICFFAGILAGVYMRTSMLQEKDEIIERLEKDNRDLKGILQGYTGV